MTKLHETIDIDAPALRVWAVVQEDVKNAPKWSTYLTKAEQLDKKPPGIGTRYRYQLDLPAGIKRVILLADGDESGEVAAKHAAYRWRREGRQVSIARPPRGLDFNDVLCGR